MARVASNSASDSAMASALAPKARASWNCCMVTANERAETACLHEILRHKRYQHTEGGSHAQRRGKRRKRSGNREQMQGLPTRCMQHDQHLARPRGQLPKTRGTVDKRREKRHHGDCDQLGAALVPKEPGDDGNQADDRSRAEEQREGCRDAGHQFGEPRRESQQESQSHPQPQASQRKGQRVQAG
jgi:hypothetical protein